MNKLLSVLLATVVVTALPGPLRSESADMVGFTTVLPAEIVWKDIPNGHGAQRAELVGSQDKVGFYVVRVRFPPHVMDTPHWHSAKRYVTVIEGTWAAGTGPRFDPAKAKSLPAGSVMVHPARGVHWDGSKGDAQVIVQIVGIGPVSTTSVDLKGPDWVDLRASGGR